jgi:hemolysin III
MEQSPRQEFWNALTHGFGFMVFIVGVPLLLSFQAQKGDWTQSIALAVFGLTLLLTFLSSTLYHAVLNLKYKRALRVIDHICIFLLIGGSYTPFVTRCLSPSAQVYFLLILWSLIAGGILYKLFYTGSNKLFSTLIYIGLGCLSLFIFPEIKAGLPSDSVLFIVIGGLSYLTGTLFYMAKKIPYNHVIWHIFVLGGAFCHFLAVGFSI